MAFGEDCSRDNHSSVRSVGRQNGIITRSKARQSKSSVNCDNNGTDCDNNNTKKPISNGHFSNGVADGEHGHKPGAKLIGIDGCWYDITSFIPHHPGGKVIEHFIGRDASDVFHGFHAKDVLKYRKPIGKYEVRRDDPAKEAFAKLHKYFIQNGYFETSYSWYAMKVAVAFSLLATTFYLVINCDQWYLHYLGAVFLAAFWQQCGFFMHDFMHSQGTHERKIDNWLGTFFGTACIGISGSWWRDEHFVHHALTNTVDQENDFWDPQMREPIWAQNEKLFPFYKSYLEYFFIKIQHITFIPICVGIGRVGIVLDSFKAETRLREWMAFAVHWMYICYLLSFLPTWREVAIFYFIASLCEGILHIQLLISHYAKPFFHEKDICNDQNWYRMQIVCNINIVNPIWLDWFHGGLNFHIEHHLYPLMPRHNYRRASQHIKQLCNELGITYDECSWSEAVVRTLKHLKTSAKHFKLDPR